MVFKFYFVPSQKRNLYRSLSATPTKRIYASHNATDQSLDAYNFARKLVHLPKFLLQISTPCSDADSPCPDMASLRGKLNFVNMASPTHRHHLVLFMTSSDDHRGPQGERRRWKFTARQESLQWKAHHLHESRRPNNASKRTRAASRKDVLPFSTTTFRSPSHFWSRTHGGRVRHTSTSKERFRSLIR